MEITTTIFTTSIQEIVFTFATSKVPWEHYCLRRVK